MAFVKTTWVPNALPAVTGAQLNRIEQGIADAHARTTLVRPNGVTTYTFNGLDGDNEGPYRLVLDGRIAAAGSDRNVRVLLRSATDNSDNSRNIGYETYVNGDDTNSGLALTKPSADAGLWVAQVRWTLDCDITSEALISCHSSKRPTHKVNCTTKPNFSDPRVMSTDLSGFLYTPRNVTSMIVDFNGAAFTGRITLEKMGLFA